MFDEIKKKLTLILGAQDAGATDALGKVDRRVDGLDKKLKTLGKISGVGIFRELSDVFEGMDKGLGTIGKIGVGLAVVEGASRTAKMLGDGLNEAVDRGDGFADALDRIGSKLPIFSSVRAGVDSLTTGLARATAAMVGLDTATAGRRAMLVGKAASGIGIFSALGGVGNELGRDDSAQQQSDALDARTRIIRKQIEDNKKDQEESNRIARLGMSERQKIETDQNAKLEEIMDRRRKWAANNGGISVEEEKRFANDELAIKADTNQKLATLDRERADQEAKALADKIKRQQEYAKQLLDEARETQKIYANQDRSRAGLIGELMEGPRGEIQRLRDRTKETIQDIQAQIEDVRNDPSFSPTGRAERIRALQGAIGTEQIGSDIRERAINARAGTEIERRIRDANEQIAAARMQQQTAAREREDAARIRGFETQQGARTSNFDGRGQTGFFNQSKSIEDFNRKTAENTKITADELKKLTQLIGQNALGSLTGGISL